MPRLRRAAALTRAAAAGLGSQLRALWHAASIPCPPTSLGPLLPWTPPPQPRVMGPWRPRIRPELRTISERVIIYYLTADVPVAATLALAGWPVGAAL